MSKRDKHTPLLCTQKNTGLNEWIRIRRHFNPGVYQCRKPGIELRVRWEGVGPLRVDRLYWKRGRRALWLVATPIRDGEGGARAGEIARPTLSPLRGFRAWTRVCCALCSCSRLFRRRVKMLSGLLFVAPWIGWLSAITQTFP